MGKSEGGAETWLMTYGDMVTLLMVFFIVLYTLTPGVEDRAFNSFISYFQKSTGFFDDNALTAESVQNISDGLEDAEVSEETMEEWQQFADFLYENNIESEIDIRVLSEGIQITLSDSLTFESGSSSLLPKAKMVIDKVAKLIKSNIKEIEVQGHTDNIPISGNSMHQTNWHLGAARAVSVVLELQKSAQIPEDRFLATSFGQYKPVSENETPAGRSKNRRVEIYLRDKVKYENPDPISQQESFFNK